MLHNLLIRDNTILAGTSGNGTWRASIPQEYLSTTKSVQPEFNLKQHISLQWFKRSHSEINVTFNTPRSEYATVTIQTLTGRQVAVLFNEKTTRGFNNCHWSCGTASGLYTIRLTTVDQVVSKIIPLVQ